MFMELVCGGDWGGPTTRGVHGMNAGWFHSPAWSLVQALSTMLSPDQRHILIGDGTDDVIRPMLKICSCWGSWPRALMSDTAAGV